MKTRLLLLAVLSALLSAPRGACAQGPVSGKVLVLDNDRTLEGDIDRLENQYRVRRSAGITWVPAERVLNLCQNKADALAFLRKRANLQDPDERLRLARWCHLQGLPKEALTEAKAAVELRPEDADGQRLLRYLSQAARHASEGATAAAKPEKTAPRSDLPAITINSESLSQFATRVQPILMNACARCHAAADHDSAFRLERSTQQGPSNRRAVQVNLAAVLAQLHSQQPERSPLLVKAASAHGPTSEAPLTGRQAEALTVLEDWVRLTLANNPQLQDTLRPARLLTREPPAPTHDVPLPVAEKSQFHDEAPGTAATPPETRSIPQPEVDEEPESEFDPLPFNRQMHPERFKASPTPRKDGRP